MSDEKAATPEDIFTSPVVGELSDAPTIFLDGAQGLSVTNEVAKINLYQVIQDVSQTDAPAKRIIVARLAMSVRTLAQLTKWLSENVKAAEKDD